MGRTDSRDRPEIVVAKTNAWVAIVVALISAAATLATTLIIQGQNAPPQVLPNEPTGSPPSELAIDAPLTSLFEEERPWLRALGRYLEIEGREQGIPDFVVVTGHTKKMAPTTPFAARILSGPYQVNGYFFLSQGEGLQENYIPLQLVERQVRVPGTQRQSRLFFVLRITGSPNLSHEALRTITFKVIS